MKTTPSRFKRKKGEPTWEIAHLFPNQGSWCEWEYFALHTNHFVEFSDGFIEVLPMPTTSHQQTVGFLTLELHRFVRSRKLGTALFGPLPVRLRPGKIREPDVLFMSSSHAARIGEKYWKGADLVKEVVSPGDESRERDLKKKRRDYARAKIREYWVIDPEEERILVLRLSKGKYVVHGDYGRGEKATSALLDGFEVDVDAVLDPK